MTNKILIVTVYNSENCGSYLQAYAMQKVLSDMGYDVGFYKRNTKGTSHALSKHVNNLIKAILKGNYKSALSVIKRWIVFEKLIKQFKIYTKESFFYKDTSKVLLGSDTIWNFDVKYFCGCASIFLGSEFSSKIVFSYAASVANTSSEVFKTIQQKVGGLKLSKYLVRDRHTQECLARVGIVESHIVCDPSLLLCKDEYIDLVRPVAISSPYIVLYYFGTIPETIKRNIIVFAKNNNLKIVSLLKQRDWCDLSTEVDPREMISYYYNASYVFTNTFHGCAFAINFNIPFAVHDVGKNKVKELLNTYNCSDRLCKDSDSIVDVFLMPMDTILSVFEERKKSMNLLKEALQ